RIAVAGRITVAVTPGLVAADTKPAEAGEPGSALPLHALAAGLAGLASLRGIAATAQRAQHRAHQKSEPREAHQLVKFSARHLCHSAAAWMVAKLFSGVVGLC